MRVLINTLLALALCSPAVAREPIREINSTFSLDGAQSVQFKAPVADLTISSLQVVDDANSDGEVILHVEIRCSKRNSDKCQQQAENIVVKTRSKGGRLHLSLVGYPKTSHRLSFDVQLTMPKSLNFEADLGVGDVMIRDLEANIEIDVGVGDVTMELDPDHISRIELDTGVGDARLHTGDRWVEGSGLVGSGLVWHGEGKGRIEVDCGVGDALIRLE